MRKLNGASGATWSDQVAHLMSREGMPRDKARDQVILETLKRGDGNVLAALLMFLRLPADAGGNMRGAPRGVRRGAVQDAGQQAG